MSEQDDQHWAGLMKQAQKGDKKAYRELLTAINPYILNILYPKISDKSAIDDVTQEILISVHNSMRTYDCKRAFKPWLHAIIHYRTLDYFRKHYKSKITGFEDLDQKAFDNDFVTKPDHAGEYKDIEDALDKIPQKQREIFEMMKIQGYTAQEIANKTGMSVSAVKVSAHRTQNKLKEQLK